MALSKYQERFSCLKSPYELSGDIDSEKGRMVTFQLELAEPCPPDTNNTTNCKTQDQITDWLKGKYILVLSNNERFINTANLFEDDIARYSRIDWIPISSQVREDFIF